MKRLLEKLKRLPRTYYIIGIPLLCGIIIGTVMTLSIPKIKADATISNSEGNNSTANVQVQPNPTGATITNHVDPTSAPQQANPTTPPSNPTAIPAQQSSTTSQQSPTVVPCR